MTTAALQDLFHPENRCFGCGPSNPDGLHLKSYEADGGYVAEWTPEERYAGPPGVVNGGMVAVPMDCHGTWAAMHAFSADRGGEPVGAVTAGYSVRLVKPMPIGQRVTLRAEVTERTERKAKVHVTASIAGDTLATFDGTFVVVESFEHDGADEAPTRG
ncbi:MAG: PaaI family thioesterase [Actinobacteria bacterium]|nr:PaaI family thioesterase [Actinomycetota bacterium]